MFNSISASQVKERKREKDIGTMILLTCFLLTSISASQVRERKRERYLLKFRKISQIDPLNMEREAWGPI